MSMLQVEAGSLFSFDVAVKTPPRPGTAYDLTSCTISLVGRASASSTALFTLAIASGITVTSASGGLITVEIPGSATSARAGQTLYYDLKVTTAAAVVHTVLKGTIDIRA